ncbi:MAG: hypothetical protein JWP61_1116 [Friedmanniella sp.]|nr:hypothetical protein [Friedmanniella sp.]
MVRSERVTAPPAARRWPLAVVVAGALVGLLLAVLGQQTWRLGCLLVGTTLVGGAVLRLLLSDRGAGLLRVRTKAFDVAALLLAGLAIVALAVVVPGHK